ncbi:ABC transporter ATP-binding protein [Streptomyces sp. NPDC127098]|uniref:ABC transporter ATP-binding protein n=1 Tax=Streptomyces sp. NPDC127098 TaxID=3347137 RepID=UPI00365D4B8E
MIDVHELSRSFGDTVAVDRLTCTVRPGLVTGFLGPNGAGKSTTLRMILGLERPTAGEALIAGVPYRELDRPLRRVGALLSAGDVHRGRRAVDHLRWLARAGGIPEARVGRVLALTGLTPVARRRAGGFSLGMGQRLGIAAALLGDPEVLVLDEPVNGLDPEGVVWLRTLLRELAAEGRTVLLASHLMSEMALTADRLLVIGRGRLLADASVPEFVAANGGTRVAVRTPDPEALRRAVVREGARVEGPDATGALLVSGMPAARVGEVAAAGGITLHEVGERAVSLEEAYFRLTGEADAVAYRGGAR